MLLDVLGVLIGFVSVMLLLSLLVTALVQLIQNLLGLRYRNLRRGLAALLPEKAAGGEKERCRLSGRLLERPLPSKGIIGRLVNPPVSWIGPGELAEKLRCLGLGLNEDDITQIRDRFAAMEGYLRSRFSFQVRIVSVACAALVAFIFQIGALDFARDLSVSPELRLQYSLKARELGEKVDPGTVSVPPYDFISDRALELFGKRHPDVSPYMEEAVGLGGTRAEVVGELEAVLLETGAPDRASLAEEYGQLLDSLRRAGKEEAIDNLMRYSKELAIFDLSPWPGGWAFYKEPGHWLGLLVTNILLTFGAPFWYEVLRNLIKLKDQLEPKPK